jgi:vacuolar-type H+-ATPase subunit I/STV1
MTARLLKITIALLTLLGEIRYTMSRLIASGLLPASLAEFQALRDTWTTIQQKEIDLYEQLSDAIAQADIADDKLDDFARRFHTAVLALTNQSRTHELFKHYFKKPLHALIRPVLSGQLAAMSAWCTSLAQPSTPPTLAAMLAELQGLVDEGEKAEARRDNLKAAIKQFREVGERKQFIDRVNAERKELHTALTGMALKVPGTPADIAQGYFKRAETPEEAQAVPEETVDSLSKEIADLEAALKAKRDRLVEVQKAEDEAAQKATEKAQKEAALAALQQDIETKQKAAKALEDELKE